MARMKAKRSHSSLPGLLQKLRRWFRWPEKDPDAPFALVGAPKKPRPPLKNLFARAKPE